MSTDDSLRTAALRYKPGSEAAVSESMCNFVFTIQCCTLFQSGYTNLYPYRHLWEFPSFHVITNSWYGTGTWLWFSVAFLSLLMRGTKWNKSSYFYWLLWFPLVGGAYSDLLPIFFWVTWLFHFVWVFIYLSIYLFIHLFFKSFFGYICD